MAAASLYLREDAAVEALEPLAATRPAFELRLGALNLRERLEMAADGWARHAHVREELGPLLRETLPDWDRSSEAEDGAPALLVNARARGPLHRWKALCDGDRTPRVARDGEEWVWAWTTVARARAGEIGEDLPVVAADGLGLVRRIWELPHLNGAALCDDARDLDGVTMPARRIFGVGFAEDAPAHALLAGSAWGRSEQAILYPGVHVIEEDQVLYGPGARVRPGAVLDAERGPILLGPSCVVHPQAVVVGPAYLGAGTIVNPGAKIREGSSIGAFCKVGGEIEEAVVHDLSNKQHDGFLGHAVLGSWVNLGADTNGSDLKNNYGPVRVLTAEGPVDSRSRFVGPMLGDHVKTGINTMLSTGTMVGACANVFGAGFPPRRIPAFTWGGAESLVEYRLDRALETAEVVFGRRRALWSASQADLLGHVFAQTAAERAKLD